MRSIVMTVVIAGLASGSPCVRSTQGQVVQLPTYHVFSTGFSALVPDRGAMVLGGVDRAVSMTRSRTTGPGRNVRILEHGIRGRTAEARVTILDHREWDAAVLAQATAPNRVFNSPKAERIARGLEQFIPTASTAALAAEARRQQNRQHAAANQNARQLIAQGDVCRQKNQPAAARIFYRTAWREGSGEVRAIAQARMKQLK